MSAKPNRLVVYGFVAVTIALVVVSLGAASYYYSTALTLTSKDAEILRLRSSALTENLTILKQELVELTQNVTIAHLNQQAYLLKNESAFLQLEVSVAEHVGRLTILTFFVNQTDSVSPNTTLQLATIANGHNGTLALVSPGCPISGQSKQTVGSQVLLYVILNSTAKSAQAAYYDMSAAPFSVFLQNVGQATVRCRVSLLYVWH